MKTSYIASDNLRKAEIHGYVLRIFRNASKEPTIRQCWRENWHYICSDKDRLVEWARDWADNIKLPKTVH